MAAHVFVVVSYFMCDLCVCVFVCEQHKDLSVLEISMNKLSKELEEVGAEMKAQQQYWLRQQEELVRLNQERQDQGGALLALQTQLTILQQKKLRREGSYRLARSRQLRPPPLMSTVGSMGPPDLGQIYVIVLDSSTFLHFTELVRCIGTHEMLSKTINPTYYISYLAFYPKRQSPLERCGVKGPPDLNMATPGLEPPTFRVRVTYPSHLATGWSSWLAQLHQARSVAQYFKSI